MASPSPLSPRALFAGRYVIHKSLGSGQTGSVYLAEDTVDRRRVALKLLRRASPSAIDVPLQDEFRVLASIDHPRIAHAFDFGYADGRPYFTREFVDGDPLPPCSPSDASPEEVLAPIIDVLEALEHVHAQGVLHLDVHPGNVILTRDPHRGATLIDFSVMGSASTATLSVNSDTWSSLPPELLGDGPVDARTDLFLVGRLLQYRLTSRLHGQPTLPREIPGWGVQATLELERVLLKSVDAHPSARFQNAREFRESLGRIIGRSTASSRVEPRSRLLGRERELSAIDASLDAVARSETRVVWLSSRSGLGKTRVLEETRVRAQLRGHFTVVYRFSGESEPSPSFDRVLRRQSRAAGSISWISALDVRSGGSPEDRARRAAQAFFASRGRPLVVLLDDFDRADATSRSLVCSLIRESRSTGPESRALFLMAAVRSHRPSAKRHDSGDRESLLRLLPLRLEDSVALLSSLLEPIDVSDRFLRRSVRAAKGSPLYIRQLAQELRSHWGSRARIPDDAEIPIAPPGAAESAPPWASLGPVDRHILELAAVIRRSFTTDEATVALDTERKEIAASLRRLTRLELLAASGRGTRRRFRRIHEDATTPLAAVSRPTDARVFHRRLARHLETGSQSAPGIEGARLTEDLGRHLLALGRQDAARVLDAAATKYRAEGLPVSAARSWETALEIETDRGRRLQIGGNLADMFEASGNYRRVSEVLGTFLKGPQEGLSERDRLRLLRRIGRAQHRFGSPREALETFATALAIARAPRDVEDLVFIDSELAEIHIFLGSFDEAEAACRRGLERLGQGELEEAYRGRMEVMLRASLGHVRMRALRLDDARREMRAAWRLASRHSTAVDRAALAHNLGVTENQRSEFEEARKWFERAERLSARASDSDACVKVAANLALIEAKLGRSVEAERWLDRGRELLRASSDDRLHCFLRYGEGVVAHLFGDGPRAEQALREAGERAEELQDRPIASFSRVLLAEALALLGRYGEAVRVLRSLLKPEEPPTPVPERVVHARLFAIECLLGRTRLAERSRRRVAETTRSSVAYLEAWNDLFLALGELLRGGDAETCFRRALQDFQNLRVPSGVTAANLGLLLIKLHASGPEGCQEQLAQTSLEAPEQRFLRVAAPLFRAEILLAQRDLDRTEENLAVSSSALIGTRFPELDWRFELARSQVARRRGELGEARRHLHRALGARDLLLQYLPRGAKESFLRHPRFAALEATSSRLQASPRAVVSSRALRERGRYAEMVGHSTTMVRVFRQIEQLKDRDPPVLITGETGCGKELVARALHSRGARRDDPFSTVHCSTLHADLFESELFGHAAGAFTGADDDAPGLLESASGGIVLLDEISSLSIEAQAKLLRFLDGGTIRRVGGTTPFTVDVRIVATTSNDLRALVEQREFREDLYYRLAGLEIAVPPLRDRVADIPPLVEHFLQKHSAQLDRRVSKLSPDALRELGVRQWKGNVRELELVLLRALVELDSPDVLESSDLAPLLPDIREEPPFPGSLLDRGLGDWTRDLEREYLLQLFGKTRGDLAAMAHALGVKSTKLYGWFHRVGLDIRELRGSLDAE